MPDRNYAEISADPNEGNPPQSAIGWAVLGLAIPFGVIVCLIMSLVAANSGRVMPLGFVLIASGVVLMVVAAAVQFVAVDGGRQRLGCIGLCLQPFPMVLAIGSGWANVDSLIDQRHQQEVYPCTGLYQAHICSFAHPLMVTVTVKRMSAEPFQQQRQGSKHPFQLCRDGDTVVILECKSDARYRQPPRKHMPVPGATHKLHDAFSICG